MQLAEVIETAQRRQRLPRPELRRLIREQARLSQSDFAQLLGCSPATVSRYETGARMPTGRRLDRYVELLGALTAVAR
jgi:transcriptional regulator with XRE-family HTH domain